MASNEYIYQFTDGGSLGKLEKKLQKFADYLAKVRQDSDSPDISAFAEKFDAALRDSVQRIRELKTNLASINALIGKTGSIRFPAGTELDGKNVGGKFATQEQLKQAAKKATLAISREEAQLNKELVAGETALAKLTSANEAKKAAAAQQTAQTLQAASEKRRAESGKAAQKEISDLDSVRLKVQELRDELSQITSGGAGPALEALTNEFDQFANAGIADIEKLRATLEALQALPKEGTQRLPAGSVLDGASRGGQIASQEQISKATEETSALLAQKKLDLTNQTVTAQSRLNEALEKDAGLNEVAASFEQRRVDALKAAKSLLPGGEDRRVLVQERLNSLKEAQQALQAQLEEQLVRFANQTNNNSDLVAKQSQLIKNNNDLELKRVVTAQKLKAAYERLNDLGGPTQGPFLNKKTTTDAERQAAQEIRAAEQEVQRLEQEASLLGAQQAVVKDEIRQSREKINTRESGGQAGVGIQEIQRRLQDVGEEMARLLGGGQEDLFNKIFGPDFTPRLERIQAGLQKFAKTDLTDPDNIVQLRKFLDEFDEIKDKTESFKTAEVPVRLTDKLLAGDLSALQRTVISAFDGIGRRFQASIQFALSGALLYGVQRLARELFDAAVEVERSFADIGTSLEFDIADARGTFAFEQQLDDVRDRVLQIATEFKALPSAVNAVAFEMVSRFTDVDAALIATRAQILATKISTINQAEALQSLTAIAQSYGVAYASITDATKRQTLQAGIYMKVLDAATVIQQKFGILLEDTVEGAGSLTETFRQLGFTVEETLAIVAAASDKTDATGAVIADRLSRSIGQIETDEIKGKLLDLARASDDFNLSFLDFKTGADAFKSLIDQADRVKPATLNKISEAFGRREAPFVRSVLGDPAKYREIIDSFTGVNDASGAAENRLAVLLDTTRGTMDGIASQFQRLATGLQKIGVLTPLKAVLLALEDVLKLINGVIDRVGDLFDFFNQVRIGDNGLGDWLKGIIASTIAATTLLNLIKSIGLALGDVSIAAALGNFFRGGGGTVSKAVGGLGVASIATTVFTGLKNTINTLKNPVAALERSLATTRAAMAALAVQSGITTAATGAATISENALAIARFKVNALTLLASIRSLGFLGILGKVTAGVSALGASMSAWVSGSMAVFLRGFAGTGAATAAVTSFTTAIASLIGILTLGELALGIPEAIGAIVEGRKPDNEGVLKNSRANRVRDLIAEREAAGDPIGQVEAYRQVVEAEVEAAVKALEENRASVDIILGLFDIFIATPPEELRGTTANQRANLITARRDQIELQLADLDKQIAIAQSLGGRRATKGRDPLGSLIAKREELAAALANTDIVGTGANSTQLFLAAAELEAASAGYQDLIDSGVFERLGTAISAYFETGSLDAIRNDLAQVNVEKQLGRLSPEAEKARIEEILLSARVALAQIIAAGADEVTIDNARKAVEEAELAALAAFQFRLDRSLEIVDAFDDPTQKIQVSLAIQRAALQEALAEGTAGPEKIREIRLQIHQLEKDLSQSIIDQAIAVGELAVSQAQSLPDRIAALDALRESLRQGIIARAIQEKNLYATAEELAKYEEISRQRAATVAELAALEAKNAILLGASALDTAAGIRANIAGIQAQIKALEAIMEEDPASDQIEAIRALLVEQREQELALALAEVDRRAAFFDLQAGTGDEILAAQAELRAAIDRRNTIFKFGGKNLKEGYDAELAVMVARKNIADLARKQADLQRRLNSDLTDSLAQALLDVVAAQQDLLGATGTIEKLEAEKALVDAESKAKAEFYNRQLDDLDFLFQTDQLSRSRYIAALRGLQAGIDRTTRQGEELWRQIELQIRGLSEQASDLAINIPTNIKLPTLFEVRRALEADALGVNYLDNRQQNINVNVSNELDLRQVLQAINDIYGGAVDVAAARVAGGAAGITIGGFN